MAHFRTSAYNLVVWIAILLPALGCGGKDTEPPPGAEGDSAPPAIELGPDSGTPKDSTGSPTSEPSSSGTPAEGQGDK